MEEEVEEEENKARKLANKIEEKQCLCSSPRGPSQPMSEMLALM